MLPYAEFICDYSPIFAILTVAVALGYVATAVRAAFNDRSRFESESKQPAIAHPEDRKLLARV